MTCLSGSTKKAPEGALWLGNCRRCLCWEARLRDGRRSLPQPIARLLESRLLIATL